MSMDNFKSFINDWIEEYISVAQPEYGDQPPCPYAKTAWINKKVDVQYIDTPNLRDFWETVSTQIINFDGSYEVVIVGMPTDEEVITIDQLAGAVDSLNSYLNVQGKDIWLLNMYSAYTIVLIQKVSKLDDASKSLETKNYYKNTNEYYFNKYVLGRRQLREKLDK